MPIMTVLSLFTIAFGISLIISEPFVGFLVIAIGFLVFIQAKNNPGTSPLTLDSNKNKDEYRRQLSILYKLSTGINGASNQLEITRTAVEIIASNYNQEDYFRGLNNQEIADYGKVFKYGGFSTRDFVLKREPDNQYDSNATAVYIGDLKIGYIPKKDSKSLAHAMDRHDYFVDGFVEITGGPYKEFDHYSDKVLTDENFAFGFRIEATVYNKKLM